MAITLSGSLILSGSIEATGGVTISGSIASASYAENASTASYVANAVSSSYSLNALTSSNAMTASSADTLYVRNNVTALGSITAQTLIVQTVTSSVLFSTGSNKIGSSLTNTQELTGSVGITGSLSVNTNGTEFQVSAGGVNIGNALTDNHIISGSVTINPNGLFVSSSGNVGIGTTTPTGTYGKLSVAGGISILNDNNAKLEIGRYSSGAPNSYIKLGANSDSLRITNNTDGADLVTITNAGNVGIGTLTPNTKLEVSGTGYFSSNLSSGGTISGGTISASGTTSGATLVVTAAINTYNVGQFVVSNSYSFTPPNMLSASSNDGELKMYMVWVWGANGPTLGGVRVWMIAVSGPSTAYTVNTLLSRDVGGGSGLDLTRTSATQLTITSNNIAAIKWVSIMQLNTNT